MTSAILFPANTILSTYTITQYYQHTQPFLLLKPCKGMDHLLPSRNPSALIDYLVQNSSSVVIASGHVCLFQFY